MTEKKGNEERDPRVLLYLRARGNVAEAASLQLRICHDALARLDWLVHSIILDMEGPDEALDCHAKAALLQKVEGGKIDVVVVARIDRIATNASEWAELQAVFRRRDVTLYSCLEYAQAFAPSGSLAFRDAMVPVIEDVQGRN